MEQDNQASHGSGTLTPPSTPPTPNVNHLSDVFSDSPPPSGTSSNHLSSDPSDIPRLRSTHSTAGYRAGISASKEWSLQPGFDEGYSLGAEFGLRVGYLLGILEGLSAALSSVNEGVEGAEKETIEVLLGNARIELALDNVFAPQYWGEDGVWKYEVHSGTKSEGETDITFESVVESHPLVRKWATILERAMERAGIIKGRFEGAEWEKGRISTREEIDSS